MHFSNHRVELGVADAFKSDNFFRAVDTLSLYLHFQNSGKAKQLTK